LDVQDWIIVVLFSLPVVVIDEALKAKAEGTSPVILFNLCGHGHFDLAAYERYLAGKLEDFECSPAAVKEALAALPAAIGASLRRAAAGGSAGRR